MSDFTLNVVGTAARGISKMVDGVERRPRRWQRGRASDPAAAWGRKYLRRCLGVGEQDISLVHVSNAWYLQFCIFMGDLILT